MPRLHVSAGDSDFEQAPMYGELTFALTPYLEEIVTRRTAWGRTVDVRPVSRFSIRRRRPYEEYRIVGRDGEPGTVIEIRA